MTAPVSIGLVGVTPHETIRVIAPRIERLGFAGLWLNDGPEGDSLAGLRVAAEVTTWLPLGTGVIPLDRRPPGSIDLTGLPEDRLSLGVGSGAAKAAIDLVRDGLRELATRTRARIVVGALGPKMRRLAAQHSDGVLFNWLTPEAASEAMAQLRRDAGERPVAGILYVRTITDAETLPVLHREAARYQGVPSYAANFRRLGMDPMDATIQGPGDLPRYRAVVDEVVLRVVTPEGSLAQLEDFVERTAAWLES